jgi:hypothetical protein
MAEYLNKQTALDAILAEYPDAHYPEWYAAKIKALAAADVAPVVHGRWIYKHRYRGGFRTYEVCDELGEKHSVRVDERYETDDPYCPECGKWNESVWLNYCPNCGVKMDGGADNG